MAGKTGQAKGKAYEEVKCNLCCSDDYDVVYPARHAGKPTGESYCASGNEVLLDQVVKCRKCGLVYVNPRLKGEAIVEGYAQAVDETYVSQARGREATFRSSLKLIEKHRPGKGRILDIGCAAGFFLKAAKESGWEEHGVEPSRWLADYGRKKLGLDIKPGTLKEAKYPPEYFDVVTLWDVLEHVPDPRAELEEAGRVLKPGGLLVVNYPNFGSRLAKIAGRRWWFLLSVHLWYFTPHTLKAMLAKTGFEQFYSKRHYQKLSLGYLAYRFGPYSTLLQKFLTGLFGTLRLQDTNVPYYASQELVLARKK
ncbi:MAG: class I SAM-dependent methyltransferase [Candidatus Micrarchaeota archaeon]